MEDLPPTLTVIVKASLNAISKEQYAIDKHKGMLLRDIIPESSERKVVEWLYEKGLLMNDQYCDLHIDDQGNDIRCTLANHPNSKKISFSGGLVWISKCCPKRWISVFNGSIFHKSPILPKKIVKLIFYWLCHNQINEVIKWLNIPVHILNLFYSQMRAVCIAANYEKIGTYGGKDIRVEVVYLPLGLSYVSAVPKVSILGVMEIVGKTRKIRLKVFDPNDDTMTDLHIFKHLLDWVHIDSSICIDECMSKHKQVLISLGYTQVVIGPHYIRENSNILACNTLHNHNITQYLWTTVRPMLEKKWDYLSIPTIQQFLDELVWRETFGGTPKLLFHNFLQHLAELTQLKKNEILPKLLARILDDPNKRWNFHNCIASRKATPLEDKLYFNKSVQRIPLFAD